MNLFPQQGFHDIWIDHFYSSSLVIIKRIWEKKEPITPAEQITQVVLPYLGKETILQITVDDRQWPIV